MFESVVEDPGADGLRRASRIFLVVAVLIALGTILSTALAIAGDHSFRLPILIVNLGLAVVAYLTSRGIEAQKNWAKWTGIVLGILELFNFPIGTVIGIAVLVYLNRAIKAGLFEPANVPPAG